MEIGTEWHRVIRATWMERRRAKGEERVGLEEDEWVE